MQTDFDDQVRVALSARRGEWPAIAKDAGVSHSWISQFCRQKIPNPGIGTLRRMAGALNKRQPNTAPNHAAASSNHEEVRDAA